MGSRGAKHPEAGGIFVRQMLQEDCFKGYVCNYATLLFLEHLPICTYTKAMLHTHTHMPQESLSRVSTCAISGLYFLPPQWLFSLSLIIQSVKHLSKVNGTDYKSNAFSAPASPVELEAWNALRIARGQWATLGPWRSPRVTL